MDDTVLGAFGAQVPLPELSRLVAPAGLILQAMGLGLRAWSTRHLGEFHSRSSRQRRLGHSESAITADLARRLDCSRWYFGGSFCARLLVQAGPPECSRFRCVGGQRSCRYYGPHLSPVAARDTKRREGGSGGTFQRQSSPTVTRARRTPFCGGIQTPAVLLPGSSDRVALCDRYYELAVASISIKNSGNARRDTPRSVDVGRQPALRSSPPSVSPAAKNASMSVT